MKHLPIFLIFFLASLASADELPLVSNPELSKVLANFEILAETSYSESAIFVRVIKVQDHGECDGSPQTCPQSTIYIATSEYGEGPEQKTYILPKKHNWKFVDWVKFTEYEGPTNYVELRLKAQVPNENINNSWWRNEYYLLKVNYQNGQWIKQ